MPEPRYVPYLIKRLDLANETLKQQRWWLGPMTSLCGFLLLLDWNWQIGATIDSPFSGYPAIGALLMALGISLNVIASEQLVALPLWHTRLLHGFFSSRDHGWLSEQCQSHITLRRNYAHLLESGHPIPMKLMPAMWLKMQQ